MRKKGIAVVFLILFLISDIFKLTSFANSARRTWYGVDMTGVVVKDGDCPIEVENEQLTFDIKEFPKSYYEENIDFLNYPGKVTAKYTFYNPADYKVTAKLVFPFGLYPEYGTFEYDEKNQVYKRIDDTAKFDIKINDKEIKKTLRHTLYYSENVFDIHNEMSMISDGFIKDDFYFPELPVTKYTYEIRGVDTKVYNRAIVHVDVSKFDGNRKYYLEEADGFTTDEKDNVRLQVFAVNGEEVILYVIGGDVKNLPKWKFNADISNDSKEIEGEMKLRSTSKLTFKEFALAEYNKNNNILEADWYNVIVSLLNQNTVNKSGAIFMEGSRVKDILSYILRWYEYEITLNPGEKITNVVEAPMYPTIDEGYKPGLYSYTYLLSPASTWARFGSLNVDINTPFFMTDSNQDGFTKTETGYNFKSNGLPEGELRFTLCESEKPKRKNPILGTYILWYFLFIFLRVLPIVLVVVVIVIIGRVLTKRGRK